MLLLLLGLWAGLCLGLVVGASFTAWRDDRVEDLELARERAATAQARHDYMTAIASLTSPGPMYLREDPRG